MSTTSAGSIYIFFPCVRYFFWVARNFLFFHVSVVILFNNFFSVIRRYISEKQSCYIGVLMWVFNNICLLIVCLIAYWYPNVRNFDVAFSQLRRNALVEVWRTIWAQHKLFSGSGWTSSCCFGFQATSKGLGTIPAISYSRYVLWTKLLSSHKPHKLFI